MALHKLGEATGKVLEKSEDDLFRKTQSNMSTISSEPDDRQDSYVLPTSSKICCPPPL